MHINKASKAHGNLGKDVWSSPSHALCTTAPEPASSELKESDTEHRFILGNLCWQRISEFFLTQQTFLPTLRPWTRAVHVSPACMGAREGFAPGVQHKCVCFGFFLQLEQKVISRFLTWVAEIYLPGLAGYKAKSKRCSHFCNHRVMSLHCYSLWIKELLSCVNLCWGIISGLHSKHALPMFCWMQWQKLAVTIAQAYQIGFFHLSLGVAVML